MVILLFSPFFFPVFQGIYEVDNYGVEFIHFNSTFFHIITRLASSSIEKKKKKKNLKTIERGKRKEKERMKLKDA